MKSCQRGFTLIEMAIALAVAGLMLSMLLGMLNSIYSINQRKQVEQDLHEIQQSLLAYAGIFGVLPCPDSNDDGLQDTCANTNTTSSTEGNLPWSTLGFKRDDPWGNPYQYRVNNALTAPFQLTTVGSGAGQIKICMDANCNKTEASNVALVVYSRAAHDALKYPVLADEIENADHDAVYVSHLPAAQGFDDQVVWISYPMLMNRMIIIDRLR